MFFMKRGEVIKIFLDKGLQISSDGLETFINTPEKLDLFFSKTIDYPPTITLDFINKAVGEQPPFQLIKTSIVKEKTTVNDFIDFFNKRQAFLSGVISKRLDLINPVSINRISEKIKKFSIIGMIKEKNVEARTIFIEDKTGGIEVVLEKDDINQLVEDEVVGVLCERENSSISGKKLIFPDVPLQREINKTKEDNYVFLVSDLHMESELFNKQSYKKFIDWLENQKSKTNIFILGDISSSKEDVDNFLSDIPKRHDAYIIKGEIDKEIDGNILPNPAFIQIGNVKLLMFHNQNIKEYMDVWNTPEQTMTNLIKKRHLDPTFSRNSEIYDNDPYLLDITPDIVVAAHTHIPSSANYKGTTLVTTGSFVTQPIFWLMNLRTRETFKIDFS